MFCNSRHRKTRDKADQELNRTVWLQISKVKQSMNIGQHNLKISGYINKSEVAMMSDAE